MTAPLSGKIALVTGASRGIGRAIALSLADAGARVIASARSADQLDAVVEEIAARGGRAMAIPADVAEESQVDNLFDVIDQTGDGLDILINNAGMGAYGQVIDFPVAEFDRIMDVNLRGVFLCCQQAMQIMAPRKSGYIINISSVVGFKGYPNQGAYTASKHAIMGLTKSLAAEAQAHGIRVSAILPGGVDTELALNARPDLDRAELLQPSDVAQAVMYLLSLSEKAAVDEIYIRRRNARPF
jgi:3-oxoacyl-[acyl-carrier protein] reductase